jgi:hypothetical protein
MVRCAARLLLAVLVFVPGCAKLGLGLRPRAPAPQPCGLPVGSEAPEISGEDIDGVPFKLSDYRGKVVLLDFWGHW